MRRRFGPGRCAPSAATIRRVVLGVDPDLLDTVLAAWVRTRAPDRDQREGLVCVAVDGKSARGARRADGRAVHLVAAVDHTTGVVQGQVAVDAKSNEITAVVPLLEPLDLTGVVVTADAMHTQDAHAKYLHRRGAHYVLIAKQNRPTLARQLAALAWKDVNVAFTCTDAGHGRVETRSIKVVRPPRRLSFPHARQAICLRRWRRGRDGKVQTETVYAVTDLDFDQVTPAQLAQIIRGHWTIENKVHHVRDVTFDEDRSQTRTGTSAQVMTTFAEHRDQPAPPSRGHHRPGHPHDHAPTRTRPAPRHVKSKSRPLSDSQEHHDKIKNETALRCRRWLGFIRMSVTLLLGVSLIRVGWIMRTRSWLGAGRVRSFRCGMGPRTSSGTCARHLCTQPLVGSFWEHGA